MGSGIVPRHNSGEPVSKAALNNSGRANQRNISEHKQLAEAYASLLLFMVVYCARPEDWIPGLSNAPLAKIAGSLALIAFVLSMGQIRRRMSREVICLILLVGQLFVTVPMSPVWMGGAFNQTVDFAKVALVVLVMSIAVNTVGRLRRVLLIQAASVAAISATAVLKGHMWGSRLAGVLNGNYSNPNDLAISIVLSLPLCLVLLFLSKNALSKAMWAFAMIIMAYAVLMTGSRAGFISLVIAGAVCLWEFGIRGRRRYLLALAAVAGVALSLASSSILTERLRGTFNSEQDVASAYGSAQARQQLLWRSIEITAKHPLFGVGPGNFQEVSGVWHETHNSYTQMSAEGGIPAFVLYVMILWYGFKNVWTTKKLSPTNSTLTLLGGALRASLAGFVVGSFFGSYAYQFFPYFLVAYTTALLQIGRGYAARWRNDEPARAASEVPMNLHLPAYRHVPV
jgi:O-antigen ligase